MQRCLVFLRKLMVAVAVMLAFAWTVPVQAQGLSATVYAPGDGSPNSLTFSIPVTASVGGRCAFATGGAPSGSFDAGAIDTAAWSHQFPFTLECTGPSRVAVVSTNGGLKNALTPGSTGYTNLAPYTVALNLVDAATTAAANCLAGTLAPTAGTPCSFRGPASTSQGLRLVNPSLNLSGSYLQVSAPAYAGSDVLIDGSYNDTLTITVSAAP